MVLVAFINPPLTGLHLLHRPCVESAETQNSKSNACNESSRTDAELIAPRVSSYAASLDSKQRNRDLAIPTNIEQEGINTANSLIVCDHYKTQ
jgi:hypothetical protein